MSNPDPSIPQRNAKLDPYLEQLGPIDGAQTVIDTAIPFISARNAAQAASGAKVVGQGALKKVPLVNIPFLAYEAGKNTFVDGWGNAIEKQDKTIDGEPILAIAEGLANPLTTIANAGVKGATFGKTAMEAVTENKSDAQMEREALAHREAYKAEQARKQAVAAARQSATQRLLAPTLFRATPDLVEMQPAAAPVAAPGGDLSGVR